MKTSPVTGINTVAKKLSGRSDSVLARKNIRNSLVSVAGLIGRPVRDENGQSKSFISGQHISKFTNDEIRLSSTKIDLVDFQRRDGESLLDADVLDHQIVDVNGLRVVRSSDLYLAPLDREIRVVGVDISFRSFIRRIFPGALSRRPTPEHVVDWASVASLADTSGVVRTSGSRAVLSQLRAADIADLIEDLAGREQNALIELLDPELAADALEEMEDEELQGLLRGLSSERAAELIAHMEPDESAEVLRDLDDEHRESILSSMDAKVASDLRELVSFDEALAGGIMTTHLLLTHEEDTVGAALKMLVENRERDISDGVVVVDARGRLIDHIQVIELVAAKSSALLSTLIGAPFPTAVNPDTPLKEVIEEFADNRGSSIIVVDEKRKPVGRILADDLVDALVAQGAYRGFAQGSGN